MQLEREEKMREKLSKRDKKLNFMMLTWLAIEIAIILGMLVNDFQKMQTNVIALTIASIYALYLKYEFDWQEECKSSMREEQQKRQQIKEKFRLNEKYVPIFLAKGSEKEEEGYTSH